MAHPWVQEKVKTGSVGPGEGWRKFFPLSFQKMVENVQIFKKCRKCSPISEVLASCFYIFALPLVKGYFSIQNFYLWDT
jgi:hypothetical protein